MYVIVLNRNISLYLQLLNYVPPPKVRRTYYFFGERGHISFSADSGRRRDSFYPLYFLNKWVEFYQSCMDTPLEQAKELIKVW